MHKLYTCSRNTAPSDPHISTMRCRWHPSHTSFSTSWRDLSNDVVYMPWIAAVTDSPCSGPERLSLLWHRSTSCNLTCTCPLICCIYMSNITTQFCATLVICVRMLYSLYHISCHIPLLWYRFTSCKLTCRYVLICYICTSNIMVRSRLIVVIYVRVLYSSSIISLIQYIFDHIWLYQLMHNTQYHTSWTGLRSIRSSDEEILTI